MFEEKIYTSPISQDEEELEDESLEEKESIEPEKKDDLDKEWGEEE